MFQRRRKRREPLHAISRRLLRIQPSSLLSSGITFPCDPTSNNRRTRLPFATTPEGTRAPSSSPANSSHPKTGRKRVVPKLDPQRIGVRAAKKKDLEGNQDQSSSRSSIFQPKTSQVSAGAEAARATIVCTQSHQVLDLFSVHVIHPGRHSSCPVPKPKP